MRRGEGRKIDERGGKYQMRTEEEKMGILERKKDQKRRVQYKIYNSIVYNMYDIRYNNIII